MEHGNNKPDLSPKIRPLFGFVLFILAAALLYAIFGKDDGSRLLDSLERLMSVALKAALAYFLIAAAGFLLCQQKQPPDAPDKEEKDERKPAAPAAEEPLETKEEVSPALPISGPPAAQVDEPILRDAPPDADTAETEEPVYVQNEKRTASSKQLRFSFQNTNADTREALDIIEGTRQGPILLAPTEKGILLGTEIGGGQYLVLPCSECLTEAELRYYPVAACFEMDRRIYGMQKAKVRCEKPALLAETENGLYEIVEKGLLTVVSIIE